MEKEIISWIYEAVEIIKSGLGDALKVDQKLGKSSLIKKKFQPLKISR